MCLFKSGVFWAGKMALRIKENVSKPGDLNLISGTHIAEGENRFPQIAPLSSHVQSDTFGQHINLHHKHTFIPYTRAYTYTPHPTTNRYINKCNKKTVLSGMFYFN